MSFVWQHVKLKLRHSSDKVPNDCIVAPEARLKPVNGNTLFVTKRSAQSLDQGGTGCSVTVNHHRIDEELEGIYSLEDAGPLCGLRVLGKGWSVVAAAHLDHPASQAFCEPRGCTFSLWIGGGAG